MCDQTFALLSYVYGNRNISVRWYFGGPGGNGARLHQSSKQVSAGWFADDPTTCIFCPGKICVVGSNTTRSYQNKNRTQGTVLILEGQVGLEPTTPCLKGRCSNRLSYWPLMRQTYGFSHRAGLWQSQSLRLLFSLRTKEINSLHYPDLQGKVNVNQKPR